MWFLDSDERQALYIIGAILAMVAAAVVEFGVVTL
jgi:hypothetical protein